MADIRLAKPAAGTTQTIPCEPSARFVFDFPATDATLARDGDDLNITLADGSALRIEDFYQEYTEDTLPSFSVDGTDVTAQDFFTAMNEPDLMPAAGPAASPNPTGARFHEWGDADLAGGIDHLNGLDWGFSRSFEWEDVPNAVGLNDDADDGGSQLLASVVPAPEAPGTVTPEPVEPPAPKVFKNVAYLWDCSSNGSVCDPDPYDDKNLLFNIVKNYKIHYLDKNPKQNPDVHYDDYGHLSFVHTAVYIKDGYEGYDQDYGVKTISGIYPEVKGGQVQSYDLPKGTFAYRDPNNNFKWTLTDSACDELGLNYGEDYIYHSKDELHHYFLGWDGKLHNIDLIYNGIKATRENVENLLNELPDNHQTNILIAGFDVKVEGSAIISLTKVDGQTTVSAKIFNYGLDGSWDDSKRYETIDSSSNVEAALDNIFTKLKSSLIWPVETSWGYNGNSAYQATNYEAAMDFATAWFHSVSSTDQKDINETFLISSGGTSEATRVTGGASAYLAEIEPKQHQYYNTSIVKIGEKYEVTLDLMDVRACRVRENGEWTAWESVSDWKDVNWAPGKEMEVELGDGKHTITIQAVSGFVLLNNMQLKLVPENPKDEDAKDYVPVVMGYNEVKNCCTPHTTKIESLNYEIAHETSHKHAIEASNILKQISSKVTGIVLGETIPKGFTAYVSADNHQLVDEWSGGASGSADGDGLSTDPVSSLSLFSVGDPSASTLAFALNFNSNLESKSGQNILFGDELGQYLNSDMVAETVRAEADIIAEIFDEDAEMPASADVLMGGANDDVLFGLGGNDVLLGDGSAAELRALANNANSSMTDAQGIVAGLGTLRAEDLASVAEEMAKLEGKTDGADRLYGGAGDDVLLGGGGDDYLNGGTGQDILFGGSGNDILVGGVDAPVEAEPLDAYNANLAFLVDMNSGDRQDIEMHLTNIMTSLKDCLEKNEGEVNILLLGFHINATSRTTLSFSGGDPDSLKKASTEIEQAIKDLYSDSASYTLTKDCISYTNYELAINYADAWFKSLGSNPGENKTFLLSSADTEKTVGLAPWGSDELLGGTIFSGNRWMEILDWEAGSYGNSDKSGIEGYSGNACLNTRDFKLYYQVGGVTKELRVDENGIYLDDFDPAQDYVISATATVHYADGSSRNVDSGAFLIIKNGVASYAPNYNVYWARPWRNQGAEHSLWFAGNVAGGEVLVAGEVIGELPLVAYQQEGGQWILGKVTGKGPSDVSEIPGYKALQTTLGIELVDPTADGRLDAMVAEIASDLPSVEEARIGDTLYGGEGDDVLFGDLAPEGFQDMQDMDHAGIAKALDDMSDSGDDDKLFGGEGNDVLFGGAGDDELHGDAGDDILYGGHGQDTLFGDSGNDYLNGGAGRDWLHGGEGDDLIVYDPHDYLIDGGDGIDFLLSDGSHGEQEYSLAQMLENYNNPHTDTTMPQVNGVEVMLKGVDLSLQNMKDLAEEYGFKVKHEGGKDVLELKREMWEKQITEGPDAEANGAAKTTIYKFKGAGENGAEAETTVTLETTLTADSTDLTTDTIVLTQLVASSQG